MGGGAPMLVDVIPACTVCETLSSCLLFISAESWFSQLPDPQALSLIDEPIGGGPPEPLPGFVRGKADGVAGMFSICEMATCISSAAICSANRSASCNSLTT